MPSPIVPGSQLPREESAKMSTTTTTTRGAIITTAAPAASSTCLHSNNNIAHRVTPGHDSKHGYYVVYLLECVARPDIELRDLLACVLKVARTRDCKAVFPHKNHIVLKCQATNAGYVSSCCTWLIYFISIYNCVILFRLYEPSRQPRPRPHRYLRHSAGTANSLSRPLPARRPGPTRRCAVAHAGVSVPAARSLAHLKWLWQPEPDHLPDRRGSHAPDSEPDRATHPRTKEN